MINWKGHSYFVLALSAFWSVPINGQSGSTRTTAPPRTYTASTGFPSNLFTSYYIAPNLQQEPQPEIYDEALDYTYPLNLTNPKTIPQTGNQALWFPNALISVSNLNDVLTQAKSDLNNILSGSGSDCAKCMSAVKVFEYVSERNPRNVSTLLQSFCSSGKVSKQAGCDASYQNSASVSQWVQIFNYGNMSSLDGEYACVSLGYCDVPYTRRSNTTNFFGPKPSNLAAPPPSGQKVKVLHLSDLHLDPRYEVGAEARCASGMCCRPSSNTSSKINLPAPLYGAQMCDMPYYLATSSLESISTLTGTAKDNSSAGDKFAWTIFTGDVASHGGERQLSKEYVLYSEWAAYHMMKSYIPGGPIYVTLGNHDSDPLYINGSRTFYNNAGQQMSWNYDHVATLWEDNGWIDESAAAEARIHYGGYSINHPQYPTLKIITINTDFWYTANLYNIINSTDPDPSGSLKFLADELTAAETAGERVWILGHVPSGWGYTQANPNPSDLFYQIVNRFSPHVIAAVFFGHTHQDHLMVYYANNGTTRNAATAQTVGWIGPSLTPYSQLNVGYRMYEVDTGDFSVYESFTYYGNADDLPKIDPTKRGPIMQFEYSARDAYPIGWPQNAPLNATFWHLVTEAMANNITLVTLFNKYQNKLSSHAKDCTTADCQKKKICAIRSGNVAQAKTCGDGDMPDDGDQSYSSSSPSPTTGPTSLSSPTTNSAAASTSSKSASITLAIPAHSVLMMILTIAFATMR